MAWFGSQWFGSQWFGPQWFGDGEGAPVQAATTTIAESIRDHMIALIEDLVPSMLSHDRFRVSRDEREANFIASCEATPASSFRRFQVRSTGASPPPDVSNTDVASRWVTIRILVAYPHNARAAVDNVNARDRDDCADEDLHRINEAVGLHGYANFTGLAGTPPATWIGGAIEPRLEGQGVDFGLLELAYRYYRAAG